MFQNLFRKEYLGAFGTSYSDSNVIFVLEFIMEILQCEGSISELIPVD